MYETPAHDRLEMYEAAIPRPLVSPVTQSRSNRVLQHVMTSPHEIALLFDQKGAEARFEQVSSAFVPFVEALRIVAVEAMHAAGEPVSGCLDYQVVMRGHQAVRVTGPLKSHAGSGHLLNEEGSVLVVSEERLSANRSSRDMEEPIREITAWSPRH
jgi:hypothetical protein